MESIGNPWLWGSVIALFLGLLALDLGVFHRKAHEVKFREALGWSIVWIALALVFNAWLWWAYGSERGMQFLTGYLLEKALSVDNLFVFLVLFSSFAVPREYEHRVLFYGIIGALVMRAAFIAVGAVLLHQFAWIMYAFGALLVVTGIQLLRHRNDPVHPEENRIYKFVRQFIPTTNGYHGQSFWVRENGRWLATPLLLVLLAVEATDLVFALDSIPAIFAITTDPFLVFTSNAFAVLGLRALFFMLRGMLARFTYLKVGLALVLAFIGVKMLIMGWYKIPIAVSLAVVSVLLGGAAIYSVWQTRRTEEKSEVELAASR